jgi:hypothetical protein
MLDVSICAWRLRNPDKAEDERNLRPWSSSWLKKRARELERKSSVKTTPTVRDNKRGEPCGR